MWEIVKFLEEDAVEAVPSVWILNNQKCFWPPYSNEKLKKSILLCEQPKTNWKLNIVQVLSTTPIDDYNVARQKSILAQTHSDVESSFLPEKRISTKNRRFISDDESEGAESPEFNDFPVFSNAWHKEQREKLKSAEQSSSQVCKERRESQICKTDTQTFQKQSRALGSTLSQRCEQESFDEQVTPSSTRSSYNGRRYKDKNNAELSVTNVQMSSSRSNSFSSSSCNFLAEPDKTLTHENMTNNTLLVELRTNKIIRMLSTLSVKMDEMSGDIQFIKEHITARQTKSNHNKIVPPIYSEFPINSEDKLIEFESFLELQENFKCFVDYLYAIGGNTTYDCVKRALSRVLSNSVAMNYNWEGIRSKRKFQMLNLCRALNESVRRLIEGCTEKHVEKDVKSWLKHAKERQGKEKKEI